METTLAASMQHSDIVRRLIDAVGGEEDLAAVAAALAYVASIGCMIAAEETGGDPRTAAEQHARLVREGVRMMTEDANRRGH